MSFIIENSTFNLYFPTREVRKSIFSIEDYLSSKGYVKPFNLVPLPSEAPSEIPRITSTTLHGHANIAITNQNIQIQTNFDKNFNQDVDKCFDYVKNKSDNAYSVLQDVLNYQTCYCGLVTQLIFDTDKPVNVFKNNFIKVSSESELFDCVCRLTFIKDHKYYINIEVQNIRQYDGRTGQLDRLVDLEYKGEKLSVTIDINDRYAYNFDGKYTTDMEANNEIFRISKDLIENRLYDLIEKGELEL